MAETGCLITGATDGMGRHAARELAKKGWRLLLLGRNAEKGARAVDEIARTTGNEALTFFNADLSSQQDIRRVAGEIAAAAPRLDRLVNNAGGIFMDRRVSADGIEMTFALNHLGYFLLTNLLLDRVKAAPAGRIVNVASAAHQSGSLDFADLQLAEKYTGLRAYQNSKLCNLYFTYELARRLEGTGVTVNALHPGFVASNIGMNNGFLMRSFLGLAMRVAARSVEEGARTIVYLASSPEVEGISGRYFMDCREIASSERSRDPETACRLWQESIRLTGLA